jgi:uncharacterized protein YceK
MKKIISLLCLITAITISAQASVVKSKTIDQGGSGPYKAVAVEESSMTDWATMLLNDPCKMDEIKK